MFTNHLPLHDQSTTNCRRGAFCRVDWDRCGFRANAKAEHETCHEHVPPRVDKALPETGNRREQTSDEDGATTTEPVVVRNSQPAADESAAKIRGRVAETSQPS